MSSIRFWRILPTRGLFRLVSRSSLQETRTEGQRLDISKPHRDGKQGLWLVGDSTHPIIIKDAVADLHEDVPRCLLECQLHILSRARASLDEQKTFLFRP